MRSSRCSVNLEVNIVGVANVVEGWRKMWRLDGWMQIDFVLECSDRSKNKKETARDGVEE